jgi:hypothetical protein
MAALSVGIVVAKQLLLDQTILPYSRMIQF